MSDEETLDAIDDFYNMHGDVVQAWYVDEKALEDKLMITVFIYKNLSLGEQNCLKLTKEYFPGLVYQFFCFDEPELIKPEELFPEED